METVVHGLIPRLTDIWTEVLELAEIDANANFFDVGGNSVRSKAIAERMSSALGERVHEHALFDAPTISSFAEYLSQHYEQAALQFLGLVPSGGVTSARSFIGDADISAVRRLIPASREFAWSSTRKNDSTTFVLSPPRSGSTLFRVMLAGHSELFVPPELNLLPFSTLAERRQAYSGRNAHLLEGAVRAVAQLNNCTIESALEILADYESRDLSVSDFYSEIQANLLGKHLVERSTSYGLDTRILERIESEFEYARYIHLLRHPAATIRSFEEVRLDRILFRGAHSYSARQLGEILWDIYHTNIRDFLVNIPPTRKMTVRFEDIVQKPEKVLCDVCDFLDIPFQDAMLDPYQDGKARMADGLAAEDPKFYSFHRIEPSISEKWKEDLSFRLLGKPTWKLADKLGYSKPGLSDSERQQILVDWQNTTAPFPDDACIHEMFESQVAQTPDGTAIETDEERLTYWELNQRANQLAHNLRRLSISPDTLIAVYLDRSVELVVGILAILKAGGAYLPIDPTLPADRVRFMLEDSGCQILVTRSEHQQAIQIPRFVQTLCLDRIGKDLTKEEKSNTKNVVKANNLAYAIYTSGSTGQPKGVLIEHRGLCNAIYSGIQSRGLAPGDRLLHLISFSFDAATWHLFTALCSGGTSVLTTKEAFGADPIRVLREEGITHFTLPASVLETVPVEFLPDLRLASSGGGVCSPEIAKSWAEYCTFINVYGPTEATIISTEWKYEPGFEKPPIGRPIENTQIYILDDHGDPLPVGGVGEIHIGGVGVARGYLNRPELTEQQFIPNPFGQGKLYKSGDLGCFLPDGNIEFVGRIDNQVKVSGFRIELGEIEAAIRRSPLVSQAAVLAFPTQLVSYIIPKLLRGTNGAGLLGGVVNGHDDFHSLSEGGAGGENGRQNQAEALFRGNDEEVIASIEAGLRSTLPSHMVPSHMYLIERFPLTHAGKVDRTALVELFESSMALGDRSEPRDVTERQLCNIWESLLEIDHVGIHANFFALGGDSMLAVRLCAQVADELEIEIEPEIVFRAPSVEKLAALIRSNDIKPKSLLQPLHPHGSKKPLYFVQVGPNWYELHKRLGEDRPLHGIKPFYGEFDVSIEDTIGKIASDYVDEILRTQNVGRFYIAGYSLGAVMAFEIAHQLQDAGKQVALLYLLDPAVPTGSLLNRSRIELLRDRCGELFHDKFLRCVFRYMRRVTRLSNRLTTPGQSIMPTRLPDPVDKRRHKVRVYQKVVDTYTFRPYAGRVLLSFSAGYRRRPWLKLLTGKVEIHRVYGPHGHLTRKGGFCNRWIRHFSTRLEEADASRV